MNIQQRSRILRSRDTRPALSLFARVTEIQTLYRDFALNTCINTMHRYLYSLFIYTFNWYNLAKGNLYGVGVVISSNWHNFFYSINKCTHALYGVQSVRKHPVSWNIKYDGSHYFTLLMYYFERAWVYFETNKIERGLSFLWHLPWEILTLCYFWGTIRPSPTNQFLRSSLFLLFGPLNCLVRSLTFFF